MMDVSPYIGLPFQELGRARTGLDCYGLIVLVYQESFGITLPSLVGRYDSTRDIDMISPLIAEEQAKDWTPVHKGGVQIGDVVVLKIFGQPWHCGIVLTYPRFLHVERGCETVIDRLDSPRWALRVEGFYRHKLMQVAV